MLLNEDSIEQVWINILDNAIKFSEAGKTLKITSKLVNDFYEVRIKDEGIGIEEDDLPLFAKSFIKPISHILKKVMVWVFL